MMEPIAAIIGVNLTRQYAHSAMPDAPVQPERPRPAKRVGPVRRGAAVTLRRLANRLEPVPHL